MHNLSAAKSTGLCLSVFIDQPCFERMLELHRDGEAERKIILKLRSRTPSPLQDCASLPPLLGLTAESGFKKAACIVFRRDMGGSPSFLPTVNFALC
jgi:hypothetical protein